MLQLQMNDPVVHEPSILKAWKWRVVFESLRVIHLQFW